MPRPLIAALTTAALLAHASAAQADEIPPESADGAAECRALQERNEKELKSWEARQPATPYVHPRPDNVLNAPWGKLLDGFGASGSLLLATLLPHLGAQARAGAPAIVVSLPWSVLVVGPMYACTRKAGSFLVEGHRVHRVLVEPGITSGKTGTGFHVRPGYRFLWHPTSWVVGPGLGLGSTVEIAGHREPFRYSISPEAVAHFGNCCSSSYFTLAVRYDHFFKGNSTDIIGGSLGYTFF